MGFIYKADVYCDDDGEAIRASLPAPADLDNESSYDSDDYPKVADVENEEADSPQHCAKCGEFFENPLTGAGYAYVQEALTEGTGDADVLKQWADFYSFEKNEDGEWVSSEWDGSRP